jgi:hypothetical protein
MHNLACVIFVCIAGEIQAGKPWTSACHFAAPWTSLAPKMKKGFRLLYNTSCDCPVYCSASNTRDE